MTTQTPDAVREAVALTITDAGYHLRKYRPHCLEALEQALAALDSRAGDAGEVESTNRVIYLLQGDNSRMAEALRSCRDQFAFYASEHTAAGKSEKAATNARFAKIADDALTAIRPATPAPAVDALPSDGTCSRCGSAPRHPHTGLCATCADEVAPAVDAVPAGEVRKMVETLRGEMAAAPKRDWYPVHRDYLDTILSAALSHGEGRK